MLPLLGGLIIAVLFAGCGCARTKPPESSKEDSGKADAAAVPEQPKTEVDPCKELASYGNDFVATCNYYKDQCISQRGNKAQSYSLASPLFKSFPMFPPPVAKDFDECAQQGARTAQLLGPLPYENFPSLYGDAAEYALKVNQRQDEPFLHPTAVDPSVIAGILSRLGNKNLGANASELEQILHARIFAAHLSQTAKKATVFVYPDAHLDAKTQKAIANSVGELNNRGVTLVGAEGVEFPIHVSTNWMQTLSPVGQLMPLADRASFKIAAKNSNVFGIEDDNLLKAGADSQSALIRAQELHRSDCEILMGAIKASENILWRSYAMAANLGSLMELKHEDAAILIIGAFHLLDLERIFNRLDINYMAVAVPAQIKVATNTMEQRARTEEPFCRRLKNACGRARLPAPGPIGTYRATPPTF
ncbi:MAG: hypothetical protein WC956_04205 [bacterium]